MNTWRPTRLDAIARLGGDIYALRNDIACLRVVGDAKGIAVLRATIVQQQGQIAALEDGTHQGLREGWIQW